MSNHFKRLLPILLLLIAVVVTIKPSQSLPPEEITRFKLEKLIENRSIVHAELAPNNYRDIYRVTGAYRPSPQGAKVNFTILTPLPEAMLNKLLSSPAVSLATPRGTAKTRLMDMIPTLFIGALILGALYYQSNGGRSKSMHKIKTRPGIRFADIAGIEEAKSEVQEVVDFLGDPAKYKRLGGNLPKGILLIGPPGTGKTMLAKAMAGEANASFFSASGSDFTEIYVGVGAKRVRELFKEARKHKPAIVFIDEIDCLGKNRKSDNNSELQQTNNALLTEMDGFDSSEGLIVVAATNRPEDLDEALLRPGRFDRKVHVPLPDHKGRRAILETHGRNTPIRAQEHAFNVLARTTAGMSGAELANVINEAAILSAQKAGDEITLTELEEARDKVRWGKERKSMVLEKDERRVVAYHEAGHAIVGLYQPLLPPLHKVSIIPRGSALGSTTSLPKEDQNLHSKTFLQQQLVVLMAGRAAETIFIGDMTNGANGDLDSAKRIARHMIHDWGMGKKLYYEPERTDAEVEINCLLTAAYEEAHQTILRQKENTARMAESLLVEETLTREQVLELCELPQCALERQANLRKSLKDLAEEEASAEKVLAA